MTYTPEDLRDNYDGATMAGTWTWEKANSNTYTVTIPTTINFSGMNAGEINETAEYTVSVKGDIDSAHSVSVSVKDMDPIGSSGSDTYITEKTTQGKTKWTSEECNAGTDSKDSINLNGHVKGLGRYTGVVRYSACMNSSK